MTEPRITRRKVWFWFSAKDNLAYPHWAYTVEGLDLPGYTILIGKTVHKWAYSEKRYIGDSWQMYLAETGSGHGLGSKATPKDMLDVVCAEVAINAQELVQSAIARKQKLQHAEIIQGPHCPAIEKRGKEFFVWTTDVFGPFDDEISAKACWELTRIRAQHQHFLPRL